MMRPDQFYLHIEQLRLEAQHQNLPRTKEAWLEARERLRARVIRACAMLAVGIIAWALRG